MAGSVAGLVVAEYVGGASMMVVVLEAMVKDPPCAQRGAVNTVLAFSKGG